MSRKESVTQKGHIVSAKDRPGRTPAKTATELSPLAKDARLPPPATSASSRAKQVSSKSTSNQTRGRSFGEKEVKKGFSSRVTNNSGHDDQFSPRTSISDQFRTRSRALRQSEQCHDSGAPVLEAAAVNNRVQRREPDWKVDCTPGNSIPAGTSEKKAVSNPRASRNWSGDNRKGVWPQKNTKELCKQCKSSLLESVCFISNDGRVAAVRTGVSVRHLHVCDSPRCAANPNYKPFLAVSKKIVAAQRLSLPSQFAKDKFSAPSRLGIRSVPSSTISSLHGDDSPRDFVAAPIENSRMGDKGDLASNHGGDRSEVDQNRIWEDEQSQRAGTESHCLTIVVADHVDNGHGVSSHEDNRPSTSTGEFRDETSDRGHDGECGNGCFTTAAHVKPDYITDSQDRKTSGHGAEVLESECCTPISQDDGACASFIQDSENERSCGGSNMGFQSECSTPMQALRDSAPNDSSEGHPKRCKEEDGQVESCCSTPLGYDDGHSPTCDSVYNHGDDELSCTDDDKCEATTIDNTTSTLSTSFEQSSNKLQRKRSSVSRMRRNYLNMLKEQEAEIVRLRKQEIQKRKQAEDWMLDCAIDELLHKLAPDGETRVKVIVEAFETVMSHSDSEIQQHPVTHL